MCKTSSGKLYLPTVPPAVTILNRSAAKHLMSAKLKPATAHPFYSINSMETETKSGFSTKLDPSRNILIHY